MEQTQTTSSKRVRQSVMVSTGIFVERVVHTTRKRPQVGTIHYEGQQRKVFIGFYLDEPVWMLVEDAYDEEEYHDCAQKTMPIEDDPEYCGEEASAQDDEPGVTIREIIVVAGDTQEYGKETSA
jgi:hypothetical protein